MDPLRRHTGGPILQTRFQRPVGPHPARHHDHIVRFEWAVNSSERHESESTRKSIEEIWPCCKPSFGLVLQKACHALAPPPGSTRDRGCRASHRRFQVRCAYFTSLVFTDEGTGMPGPHATDTAIHKTGNAFDSLREPSLCKRIGQGLGSTVSLDQIAGAMLLRIGIHGCRI